MLTGSEWPGRRHGIHPLPAPRLAPPETAQAEQATAPRSVSLHGLKKITRARRLKAASASRAGKERQHRRDEQLIAANGKLNDALHKSGRITLARRTRRNHSSRNSENATPTARCRATITTHVPGKIRAISARTISRRRRRTRFRSTAAPTRREVMMPTFTEPAAALGRTLSNINFPCIVMPSARMR